MRTFLKSAKYVVLLSVLLIPAASFAQVAVSIRTGPPVLPVYEQPLCPGEGYLWTPGYWAYGPAGYYWVPGVWVTPPRVGVLWTPGYWGSEGGFYRWHAGYWGPHVGFYGGINYGFGYGGAGFFGGRWVGDFRPTSHQFSHEHNAGQDHNQFASENHGRPGTMAMESVNGRRYNQQGRIANGVSSGQLTPGETKNLEGRESHLNDEIHNERSANGGTLTPQERQQVNRQKNHLSRSVYDDKHNASTEHYGNNEVGARRDMQQRIADGVGRGQMSASEAAKAENREQNINGHIAADRHANGGKLTPQEHQNIKRRQNGASRQIYREKHNEKEAPGRP